MKRKTTYIVCLVIDCCLDHEDCAAYDGGKDHVSGSGHQSSSHSCRGTCVISIWVLISTSGGCAVGQCSVNENCAVAVYVRNCDQGLVQAGIRTVAEKIGLVGAVSVLVTPTLAVFLTQTLDGFGLVAVRCAVVVSPWMDVWV